MALSGPDIALLSFVRKSRRALTEARPWSPAKTKINKACACVRVHGAFASVTADLLNLCEFVFVCVCACEIVFGKTKIDSLQFILTVGAVIQPRPLTRPTLAQLPHVWDPASPRRGLPVPAVRR